MLSRWFDMVASAVALVILSPVFILIGIAIKLTSPGPMLYCAQRVGKDGHLFIMHKFRTMHVKQTPTSSVITAANDDRVYSLGKLLRKLKIDELPQLFDVLRGKMAIVGPRPEDPSIVENYYTSEQMETLSVTPGLASPGSIYNYTHGDQFLNVPDPEKAYICELLPVKLALELVYVRHKSFFYDIHIIVRTIVVIFTIAAGKKTFCDPPEMAKARKLLQTSQSK